ncbi:MAG: radical SAM protein [Clostridia bacterium]|nr:radical SAM protein [Clostridia bacterium]
MKHANISIFVPHLGCPCKCSFCNQRYITGQTSTPTERDVDTAVKVAMQSKNYDCNKTELAYFGGSFTAIDREYMTNLLKWGKKHIDAGNISGIRISTRPDCIDDRVLKILKQYGVTAIELGAQSMQDKVLKMNNRGHDANAVIKASQLIKSNGFSLGLQMMTGLYGDNDEGAVFTAKEFIKLKPDTVRVYPTVVLKNTDLAALYRSGEYTPQTVEQAATLGAVLLKMFFDKGIDVIRFGLHTIDEDSFVAGPWHPALAELAYSEIYYNIAVNKLSNKSKGDYVISVKSSDISKMIGQKRSNILKLKALDYNCTVVPDDSIKQYDVDIKI